MTKQQIQSLITIIRSAMVEISATKYSTFAGEFRAYELYVRLLRKRNQLTKQLL